MADTKTDIPQSAKNAQRQEFLRKKNKRKSKQKTVKDARTGSIVNPKPLKKAKKVK